ncbi:MAG TPA: histidine phosphatase family protein [Dermatophilaceae bacterium]
MSDLQCPATMLVARHGAAAYAVDGVLLEDDGALTDKGRDQVRHLVEQVRSRRVAAVYSSQMGRAIRSAELAASELGLHSVAVDGLQEFSVGDLAGVSFDDDRAQQVFDGWLRGDLAAACPGAEDGHAVVTRFKGAIDEIADSHRGETVLVFTHGGAMSLAIPRLSVNLRNGLAVQRFLPHCVAAEIEVDADGWRVVTWPGATDTAIDQITS